MSIKVRTWGTGAAFGRMLGSPESDQLKRRDHAATSVILEEDGQVKCHILLDAGAPCTEKMIEARIKEPDALFITHPHYDHTSDLIKLANSRRMGFIMKYGKKPYPPLPVIARNACIYDSPFGMKSQMDYKESDLEQQGLIKWEAMDDRNTHTWYTFWKDSNGFHKITIEDEKPVNTEDLKPLFEYKSLPVVHAPNAPGAGLFILRFPGYNAKIVLIGDFSYIPEEFMSDPDLLDPSFLIIETNSLHTPGPTHSSWDRNKAIINRLFTGKCSSTILLNHISGFGDYTGGFYDHVPNDDDWAKEIAEFHAPPATKILLAEDFGEYNVL